jgi:DNA polymerase I-like protein with 3'-5' exonuclease and polymerase domains
MLGPEDRQITNWRGRRVPVRIGTHSCWFYPITDPVSILRTRNHKKKGAAYLRAFERDLARVFADAEAGLPEPYVEDPKDYHAGVECLTEYGRAGFDTIERALGTFFDQEHSVDIETDGLRPYRPDAKIITMAVGTYDSVFAFPWEHPEARWTAHERGLIKDLVHDYLLGPGKKWAHSTKFEQEWFHKWYGPDVLYKTEWGDTLLQAHALDDRKGKGLDDLTQLYFGFRLKSVSNVDVKKLEYTPLSRVLPYNALDVKYCYAASVVQAAELEQAGLVDVYNLLHRATPALVRMQAKGVVRNLPAIEALDSTLTKQHAELLARTMRDRDVLAFMQTGRKFSPSSNQDLVVFFRDYLKVENPVPSFDDEEDSYSVDEGALSQIKHAVAKLVLELRAVTKNHGYVTPLLPGGKYVHADGLVHANYSNAVAVSGRTACEDPNQQNYPRRAHKEIRRVVGCPPGHVFVAFDYKQLEWRIGACLSGDVQMGLEIRSGEDIHGVWTDSIGGRFVPARVKENRKSVRDSIKQYWTFANLYGQILDGLAWDLSSEFSVNISKRELEPFFISFWQRYPALRAYQDAIIDKYWRVGYVETATGQRRHEPMARNEIINHPFQGTAGHLVLDAQQRVTIAAYEQDRPSLQPIMNIHDDLSFYLPYATVERDIEDIARFMCVCPFEFVTVPLGVEVSVGENWCDKEEIGEFSTGDFDA